MSWITFQQSPYTNYLAWEHRAWQFAAGWQEFLPTLFDMAIVCERGHCTYELEQNGFRERGRRLLSLILDSPAWFDHLHWETTKHTDALFALGSQLGQDPDLCDRVILANGLRVFFECYHRAHDHGVLTSMLEFDHELFTKYLLDFLQAQRVRQHSDVDLAGSFSVLTTPTRGSITRQERRSLLRLALRTRDDDSLRELFLNAPSEEIESALAECERLNDSGVAASLREHLANFGWLPYGTDGPGWGLDHFIDAIKKQLLVAGDLFEICRSFETELEVLERQQEELVQRLGIDDYHCDLFRIARDMVYLKAVRKEATSYAFAKAEPALRGAARMLDLAMSQLHLLTPEELLRSLSEGRADIDSLNERREKSALVVESGRPGVLVDSKADAFIFAIRAEAPNLSAVSELMGTCAVSGTAKGTVRIVNSTRDMGKMERGDILVSYVTDVQLEPAIVKAAAVVTDSGGLTSHASIFCREVGIICLVGTRIATKVFRDGDLVEVDADRGVVRLISKAQE